ncbi:MAG TPA: hypothetical protein VND90_10880 [Terracidiphilus sp.]|nr:hypothetical protein [Terracidiphilus sp.]
MPMLLLLPFFFSLKSFAQELWPGMGGYLKLTFETKEIEGAPIIDVTNLYHSPLVAVAWKYRCDDPEHKGHDGNIDAAMTYSEPWAAGQTLRTTSAWKGCTGGITAAIWADGKELGDLSTLQEIHECRDVNAEVFHSALEEGILKSPISEWDPARSLEELKTRRAQFAKPLYTDNHDLGWVKSCHWRSLDYLIYQIKNYQSSVEEDPNRYGARRDLFVQYLMEMEKASNARTFPTHHMSWKR